MLLFLIKVAAGFFYGHYFAQQSQIVNADTWKYYIESLHETKVLLENPKEFFLNTFKDYHLTTGGIFESKNSFWNNLKSISFTKFLAIINLFSNQNYYVNVIILNILFMFGGVALFKLINENFKLEKRILIISVFLIPSFLFWCSALHKDGLIFSATSIIIYLTHKTLHLGITRSRFLFYLLCLLVVFMLRNYFLLTIIPSLVTMILVIKFGFKPKVIFASVTFFCLFIFVFSNSSKLTSGIIHSVVLKHNEFAELEGNTKFKTPNLELNPTSIIEFFPFAMEATFLRPYPTSLENFPKLIAALENYCILILFIFVIVKFFTTKGVKLNFTLIYVFMSICFFWFLFVGYIVCFDGAIVRYKSVVLPFWVSSFVILIFGKAKTPYELSI